MSIYSKYISPNNNLNVSKNVLKQLSDDICNEGCKGYDLNCVIGYGFTNTGDERRSLRRCRYFHVEKSANKIARELGVQYVQLENIKNGLSRSLFKIKDNSFNIAKNDFIAAISKTVIKTGSNLYLTGINGIGKTTLAASVAVELIKGLEYNYLSYKAIAFRYNEIEEIPETDILILDEVRIDQEKEMILLRYLNRFPGTIVIMTSNHLMNETIIDNSIISRLQAIEIVLIGEDMRKKRGEK